MQVIPINLPAVRLRDLRCFAFIAQGAGLSYPLSGVFMCAGLVVQGPDQFGQLAATQPFQLSQRLFGKRVGRHRRHCCNAVMHQSDSVEDPLDNPQLGDVHQFDARWTPPNAARTIARLEPSFHLAEAMRTIDQPFPIAPFVQGEADRSGAFVQLSAIVGLLAKPALNQLKAKPTGKLQICSSCCGGILIARGRSPAPVIEQILIQFLNVPALRTFAFASANDQPRF